MARRQQQGGQRRLVGQLEQEDDREDGEPETQGVRHWGGSLSAQRLLAQWSQSGKERTKTSRPRARVRMLIPPAPSRSEEHTSELQSQSNTVCRLLLEKKKTLR